MARSKAELSARDWTYAYRDKDLLADLRSAVLLDASPIAGLGLLLLASILVAAYIWASHAEVDEMTRGMGKVIPSSHEQVIQSLEGGILSALLVKEGDKVNAGQVLLRIDPSRFDATYRENQSRQQTLSAAIARLRAEAGGHVPVFPTDLPSSVVETELKLYRSQTEALGDSLNALTGSLKLAQQELDMTAPLVQKGAVSEVEVLRLRREVNELKGKIEDRRNSFLADARQELATKEGELSALTQLNSAQEDQVRRTVIRAPMRGTVKNIKVNTVGGVIEPGMAIMEIVPLQDRLLVEARIHPKDVAFLRPGLPATVKITAYDYSIYGGLKGKLVYISADTVTDPKNPNEAYYVIRVRTDKSYLSRENGELPIIPGMTATVEVQTGHKTVLDYLLKPVLNITDSALHER